MWREKPGRSGKGVQLLLLINNAVMNEIFIFGGKTGITELLEVAAVNR